MVEAIAAIAGNAVSVFLFPFAEFCLLFSLFPFSPCVTLTRRFCFFQGHRGLGKRLEPERKKENRKEKTEEMAIIRNHRENMRASRATRCCTDRACKLRCGDRYTLGWVALQLVFWGHPSSQSEQWPCRLALPGRAQHRSTRLAWALVALSPFQAPSRLCCLSISLHRFTGVHSQPLLLTLVSLLCLWFFVLVAGRHGRGVFRRHFTRKETPTMPFNTRQVRRIQRVEQHNCF